MFCFVWLFVLDVRLLFVCLLCCVVFDACCGFAVVLLGWFGLGWFVWSGFCVGLFGLCWVVWVVCLIWLFGFGSC